MKYKVTYAIDSLDPNPTIKIFDFHHEMEDWITDEVSRRVQFWVDHSSHSINEFELQGLEQDEFSLITIEEVE